MRRWHLPAKILFYLGAAVFWNLLAATFVEFVQPVSLALGFCLGDWRRDALAVLNYNVFAVTRVIWIRAHTVKN
jgi:hypothetical protein